MFSSALLALYIEALHYNYYHHYNHHYYYYYTTIYADTSVAISANLLKKRFACFTPFLCLLHNFVLTMLRRYSRVARNVKSDGEV